LAYVAEKDGQARIVVVDPATGATRSREAMSAGLMGSLDCLSCGGRYAAFWTGSVVARFHIMDTETGRTVRLLRAPHYTDWGAVTPSWSPVGHRLAMECTDAVFPRPTQALYLLDLAAPK
jgi:dipeptidyl aminopeptidase/acylaminoacyl peptidase